MPSLGADMDQGTVIEWLVKPGDAVHKGDVVAVVDTVKAAVDVECFDTGVVTEILVPAGQKVPVGTPLAVIETAATTPLAAAPLPADTTGDTAARALASPPARKLAAEVGLDLANVHGTGRHGHVTRGDIEHALHTTTPPAPERPRISPYARRLATELGVDVTTVPGTGPAGEIRARDIRAAQPAEKPIAAAHTTGPDRDNAAMRRAIAALMARSKREIPHYYLTTTIDMSAALAWLHNYNRGAAVSERLLPATLLLKASALAAQQVPALNGHWVDDTFVPGPAVHLGVAISLRGGGLIAPAILDADALALPEIMRRLRELVSRSRSGRLRSSEMTAATITVTNLGDLGVESVHGVIYPPQVALVGFGAVVERPWAVGGLLGVRSVVTATLSADHRASDGATGAGFLHAIDHLLQQPEEL